MSKNIDTVKIPTYQIPTKKLYTLLVAVGVCLFLLAGFLWWRNVYASPKRVFWGMLENNLASYGVTRRTGENTQQGSTEQYAELGFGDQTIVHGVTYLRQQAQEGESRVVTETIATPEAGYNRYTNIQTPVKNAEGESLDFSSVVGKWGKTEPVEGQENTPGQYLSDYFLGIVPFGYLQPESRRELVKFMQEEEVFTPNFSMVERSTEGGKLHYKYSVAINPAAYIGMLQKYAELSGMGEIPGLLASAYEDQPDITVDFVIEPYSRNLQALVFPEAQGGRQEEYFSHGVRPGVQVPDKTVPINELQQQLQSIQ